MKYSALRFYAFVCVLLALFSISLSACNQPTVEKNPVIQETVVALETVVATQVSEIVFTATPVPPTATQLQPTPENFSTSTPFTPGTTETPASNSNLTETPGTLPEGFSAWCVDIGSTDSTDAWVAPQKSKPAVMVSGNPQLLFPSFSCTFVFSLDQPYVKGTQLWIYDRNPSPWLKKDILAVPDNPKQAYIVLKHTYITEPPFWQFDYRFEVRQPDGEVAWEHDISFKNNKQPSWRCRTNNLGLGVFPDPATGKCPGEIELHPWDEGFGTPGPEWTDDF